MHLFTFNSKTMTPEFGRFSRHVSAIFFLIALLVFMAGSVIHQGNAVSLQEKRELARFPIFFSTVSEFPEWKKSVDAYFQDHFLFRDKMISFNSILYLYLFNINKSKNWIILPGKEGWLFYIGDWALHNYLRKPSAEDEQTVRSWKQTLVFRQRLLAEKHAEYLVAIAPNKEDIYPEYFPERFVRRRGTTMPELMDQKMRTSSANSHFLDLTEPLQRAKNSGQIYFKTDSHWNDRGAYAAYRAIMERIQQWYPHAKALAKDQCIPDIFENSSGGDLVLAMGLNEFLTESTENWQIKENCAGLQNEMFTPKGLSEGESLEKNGCRTGIPLRVLIISDSFGDGMMKFFNETFQDVVYSREIPFPLLRSFIEEYQPDIVLDLRVARNLSKVMSPGQDEAY